MEKFKAVEKEMKTKAYSKEGLSLAAKMDPKDREKVEMCNYLSDCVDSLERQIEQLESEAETLHATQKKSKKGSSNAERVIELERQMERHKWHQSKLELLLRTLENGGIEADEVKTMQDDINYYVDQNQDIDFMEDDGIYDHLNLQEEEEIFGMGAEADRVSSQDAQSIADDADTDLKPTISATGKSKAAESATSNNRRPSTQLKSPLPALATLHAPMTAATNGTIVSGMKPAPPPARVGEPLKYASAAAAAAASDQNELGIAPLPPPAAKPPPTGLSPATLPASIKTPSVASPSVSQSQPSAPQPQRNASQDSQPVGKSPAPGVSPAAAISESAAASPAMPEKVEPKKQESKKAAESSPEDAAQPATPALTNGDTHSEVEEEESIYHLPASLNDLLESFEATKSNSADAFSDPTSVRLFAAGYQQAPEAADAERPRHYRPQHPYPYTPSHFPQEPSQIFDDPRLYSRVDTDTLFYAFYYRQGTYQQYLSAKALKNQSWRFHKQYQTWFQRHEEPKSITEDYEQGTYRFFDYESTW
jgi:CCR4-NOT transcription complex subunit 3